VPSAFTPLQSPVPAIWKSLVVTGAAAVILTPVANDPANATEQTLAAVSEPRRDSRRLQLLREWSYGKAKQEVTEVFPGIT